MATVTWSEKEQQRALELNQMERGDSQGRTPRNGQCCCPVPLGNGLFRFIKKPVYLALEPLAGHDGGVVITAAWIGPVGPMRSRKGVLAGVVATGVKLVASNRLPVGTVISGQNSTSASTPTSLTRSAKLLRACLAGGPLCNCPHWRVYPGAPWIAFAR